MDAGGAADARDAGVESPAVAAGEAADADDVKDMPNPAHAF